MAVPGPGRAKVPGPRDALRGKAGGRAPRGGRGGGAGASGARGRDPQRWTLARRRASQALAPSQAAELGHADAQQLMGSSQIHL